MKYREWNVEDQSYGKDYPQFIAWHDNFDDEVMLASDTIEGLKDEIDDFIETQKDDEIEKLKSENEALKKRVAETPTELQKLQWANKALKDALQYLVDTKKHKDTIGKDSIYMQRKRLGWMKAKSLLSDSE